MTGTADRDLILVQQDAVLLDAVSRRADLSAFAEEPLAALLAALAADVDRDGLGLVPSRVPAEVPLNAAGTVASLPARRRTGAVVLTVAALLVGSSGVAAAVTGDPLAGFKNAVHLVTGAPSDEPSATPQPSASGTGVGRDGALPDTAAAEAQLNKQLDQVGVLIARGDLDAARALLAAAQTELAGLSGQAAAGLQNRLDALAARIDRAAARPSPGATGHPDSGNGGANPARQHTVSPNSTVRADGGAGPNAGSNARSGFTVS